VLDTHAENRKRSGSALKALPLELYSDYNAWSERYRESLRNYFRTNDYYSARAGDRRHWRDDALCAGLLSILIEAIRVSGLIMDEIDKSNVTRHDAHAFSRRYARRLSWKNWWKKGFSPLLRDGSSNIECAFFHKFPAELLYYDLNGSYMTNVQVMTAFRSYYCNAKVDNYITYINRLLLVACWKCALSKPVVETLS